MRLLILGDLHWRLTAPKKRKDNYVLSQAHKMEWIFDLAKSCDAVIQPGDVFDSHKAPDELKRMYIRKLLENKVRWFCVYGQHDMRWHSAKTENTPLAVLEAAKVVTILGPTPPAFGHIGMNKIKLYGAGWNESVPEIIPDPADGNTLHILVTHRMIVKDEKAWKTQELTEGSIAFRFMKKYGFDLVVVGDNHNSFVYVHPDGRHMINCGSLMRSKIDQLDHKPVVYILDTETREYTEHFVPIKPASEVFDLEREEEEKEENEELGVFIEELKKQVKPAGIIFEDNLAAVMAQNSEDTATIEMLEEILEECEIILPQD